MATGCRHGTAFNDPNAIMIAGDRPQVSADLVVVVSSDQDANGGNPVHMMIRSVDAKTLSIESYEAAADVLFASPPDPSVLDATVIFPERQVRRSVVPSDAEGLGLYFFVADEDPANWRLALPTSGLEEFCVRLSSAGATAEDCHLRGASPVEA